MPQSGRALSSLPESALDGLFRDLDDVLGGQAEALGQVVRGADLAVRVLDGDAARPARAGLAADRHAVTALNTGRRCVLWFSAVTTLAGLLRRSSTTSASSRGLTVNMSTTVAEMPFSASISAALSARPTMKPHAMIAQSPALAQHDALADLELGAGLVDQVVRPCG